MKYLHTFQLNDAQKSQVRDLWNQEYPVNIQHPTQASFENYLSKLIDQRHILIENEKGIVKAWYADFMRDQERWFAMIVDRELQGKGFGKILLEKGKENNVELNGWVVHTNSYAKKNGEPYQSPLGFYKKCGFQLLPEVTFDTDVLKTIQIKWQAKPLKKIDNS